MKNKIKKPKLRMPTPPPSISHGDKKKDNNKNICREKVEKNKD